MAAKDQRIERRRPRQARSQATWEAILEAASQILERRGLAALNTNAVAERAGVSIGTLYQYFADKRAILVAAAQRELAADPAGDSHRRRALIEALIAMLQTLGGLGGAAAGGGSTRTPQPPRRPRGESWERRLLDLAHGWVVGVLAPPPALRPIPIQRRAHVQGDRR
ncbi:MAG TPA: helix-turn-helix domain-containing protein [Caulobacteraceae bacterium]|nr:helix-turn-helix domain-containing protein [Caulobacteraceae bacterium]